MHVVVVRRIKNDFFVQKSYIKILPRNNSPRHVTRSYGDNSGARTDTWNEWLSLTRSRTELHQTSEPSGSSFTTWAPKRDEGSRAREKVRQVIHTLLRFP